MSSKLEQKLNEFREIFKRDFNSTLSALQVLWNIAKNGEKNDIKKFRFEVHSLKGSSATLNFSNLSNLLQKIESLIANHDADSFALDTVTEQIDSLMQKLTESTQVEPNPLLEIILSKQASILPNVQNIKPSVSEINLTSHRDISVAIIDSDKQTGNLMCKLLTTFGFAVNYYASIPLFIEALSKQTFSIAIVDVNVQQPNRDDIFKFASQLKNKHIDVFIVSSPDLDTFDFRLLSIRAGVNDYLLKPLNITNLVNKIRKNFKIDLVRPYRILLLDDDLTICTYYKTLLEAQDIEVIALSEAQQLMAVLESFPPDIFLLDMYMPNISGLEIAKLIRQQPKYDYVPILFLTSDSDINTKLLALKTGADDVIPKQTPPKLILEQIESRIERSQQIRYLASRDSLTGVLNHGQIMDAAAQALRLAARHVKPVVMVMIDLDYFKKVNDSYGHMGGDKVLVSLGQLLLQSVRETDFVGRYGGEEFIVVFCDADCEVIHAKMESILSAFRQIEFNINEHSFNCTFSAGMASSENYDTLSELIAAADAALYHAKNAGRNTIIRD